jgi:hypothetical protein
VSSDATLPSIPNGLDVAACSLLTREEIAGIVGNAVEEGGGLTNGDCDWQSDPYETSASLVVTATGTQDICVNALGEGEAVDDLEIPAFWNWSDVQGGGGTISMCTPGGNLVIVAVSAGLEDDPDEPGLKSQATSLAQILIGRL